MAYHNSCKIGPGLGPNASPTMDHHALFFPPKLINPFNLSKASLAAPNWPLRKIKSSKCIFSFQEIHSPGGDSHELVYLSELQWVQPFCFFSGLMTTLQDPNWLECGYSFWGGIIFLFEHTSFASSASLDPKSELNAEGVVGVSDSNSGCLFWNWHLNERRTPPCRCGCCDATYICHYCTNLFLVKSFHTNSL